MPRLDIELAELSLQDNNTFVGHIAFRLGDRSFPSEDWLDRPVALLCLWLAEVDDGADTEGLRFPFLRDAYAVQVAPGSGGEAVVEAYHGDQLLLGGVAPLSEIVAAEQSSLQPRSLSPVLGGHRRQMDDREVVNAFVGHLRANGHPDLEIDSRPDEKDHASRAIDAIAGPFAIEHTSVDVLANQRERPVNYQPR